MGEIEEEAKTAGVDAFIAKPLFRSRLRRLAAVYWAERKIQRKNYLENCQKQIIQEKRILLVEG